MYAKIENGQVVGSFYRLPSSYENVSGFDTLSDTELAGYGIVPVVEIKPDLLDYQTYGEPIVTVGANSVTRTYPVVQKDAASIEAGYVRALEALYDIKAQERKYDTRYTCALRAGYVGPFQAEGQSFALWMDTCNAHAYVVMRDVLSGVRAVPTIAELIAELPALVWPV